MNVNMPILHSDCFNKDSIVLITKNFIEEHRQSLECFSGIFSHLEGTEDIDEARELILADSYHDNDFSLLFGDDNDPHEHAMNRLGAGIDNSYVINLLRDKNGISRLINDSGELDIELIEEASELDCNEMYPLFSKPTDKHICYCLQNLNEIAFFEIEGCYFMGLTTSGSDMSAKIAYGYMLVDNCVPSNYISDRKYLGLSDKQEETLKKFIKDNS
jgi:hypothetical protein